MTADTTLAPCPTEREQFVSWLSDTYPHSYTRDDAELYWEHSHVSALAWQAARAQAAPQGPALVPKTDEQVDDLCGEANRGFDIEREHYFKAFRDAEAAHGITGAPNGKPT